jgi:tetratricopeptide (TPR) repeat protein
MKVLLSVLVSVLLGYNSYCQTTADSLLNVLKTEIQKKRVYDDVKYHRIKLIKQRLTGTAAADLATQYTLCDQLYCEYKDFIFDSAHVYALTLLRISSQMHDMPRRYGSLIKLGTIQLSWGMFKETFDGLNQVKVDALPDSIKLRYYELKTLAYNDLAFYNTDEFYAHSNRAKSVKALDSAILYASQNSYERYKHMAERYTIAGRDDKAAECYKKLLYNSKFTYHERAMVANDLSNLTDGPQKNELITLAAIYDIRSSTKETLAIFTLGKAFFYQGNMEDAEILLQEALDQALFYGNRLHKIEITAILTTLSAQKLILSENKKNKALTFLITVLSITILGTIAIALLVYIRLKRVRLREKIVKERNQHLDHINKKLLEDTHIKEEYIGYFFNIISGYILKMEKIKRNTERKLKSQNYEELLKLAHEIDIKQEREALFYTFDNIFLKLFPNFITTFNSLLKPEDQIWPKDNEVLNTNLRIFALMRLGIKDNQTIANILESAVSTIYTYKIRIKSKALVQGDEFDNKIMEIKFVEVDQAELAI